MAGNWEIINQIWNQAMNSTRFMAEFESGNSMAAPCRVFCTGMNYFTNEDIKIMGTRA